MHVNCEFQRCNIKCDVIKPLSLLKFDSHQISDPLCIVSLGGIAIEFNNDDSFYHYIDFLNSFYSYMKNYTERGTS